jgi:hypothetical protein
MSSPLFGGGGQSQMNPLLMLMAQPQLPQTPPPVQSPQGSQTSSVPQQNPSFVSAAAPVPNQQNVAPKSLLGQ